MAVLRIRRGARTTRRGSVRMPPPTSNGETKMKSAWRISVVGMAVAALAGCSSQGLTSNSEKKAAISDGAGALKKESLTFETARVKDRVIVRKADLAVQTSDASKAATAATRIADGAGGYVDSQQADFNRGSSVSMTLKVAADQFDRVLSEIEALGKVQNRQTSTEDVTAKSVDLDARVKAQRAAIDRLEVLAKEAANVPDVLNVERELGTRLAELDSLQAQLDTLDKQTQFATITVNFSADAKAAKKDDKKLPGFLAGLRTGWRSFVGFVTVLGASLGFLIPYAIPLTIIGAVVVSIRRRRQRKSTAATVTENLS